MDTETNVGLDQWCFAKKGLSRVCLTDAVSKLSHAMSKTHGTSRKKEEGKRERREREEEMEERKKEKKDAWNQLKRETRSFCLLLLIAAATPCGVTVFSSEPHAIFAFAVMLGNSPFASFD